MVKRTSRHVRAGIYISRWCFSAREYTIGYHSRQTLRSANKWRAAQRACVAACAAQGAEEPGSSAPCVSLPCEAPNAVERGMEKPGFPILWPAGGPGSSTNNLFASRWCAVWPHGAYRAKASRSSRIARLALIHTAPILELATRLLNTSTSRKRCITSKQYRSTLTPSWI